MFGASGQVLYVGKARNLKRRVSSYFRSSGLSPKTAALVSRITAVEVTVTSSETEALLLEQNLIKSQRPVFNILLRDDKSYPYVFLSDRDEFPRLAFHRGAKRKKGRYFGPFPSAGAVRESLNLLQKMFLVRQCEDSFFRNRSRPCLQHQIKRCSAPCVNAIEVDEYRNAVRHTVLFLEGRSAELKNELGRQMDEAAESLEYEKAAEYRDQLAQLQKLQERQFIESGDVNLDVHAAEIKSGVGCVHSLFVRDGRVLGSKSYFPKTHLDETAAELLEAFASQFYLAADANREVPPQIVVSEKLENVSLLEAALTELAGRRVRFLSNVKSARSQWLALAQRTAHQNLQSFLANRQHMRERFEQLQDILELDEMPQRIECFDISHSSGELTVGSCVVFDVNGPVKSDYRRFNIDDIAPGDDYAAMQQALSRRYTRLQSGEGKVPDLLLIDGGKGQLTQAESVLEGLQVAGVVVLAVAKGTTRKPGFETLLLGGSRKEIVLESDAGALHLIQQVRDEAHRFAITGHKQRRARKRSTSPLEGIPGIGPKRRRELLRHFGGIQGVERASIEELMRVPGINRKTAEDLYAVLHDEMSVTEGK